MQPNRIEEHWTYLLRQLNRHYPLVPTALWEQAHWQPDQIVRLICETYVPGRSEITVEAEVKDLLVQWCNEAEGCA